MKALKYALAATLFMLLVGCGPSLEDAKKLGFDSVDEMKALTAQGFKTKNDWLEEEAKKLGFESHQQKLEMKVYNIRSGQEMRAAKSKMKELGFESLDEMKKLEAAGFKTKAEKVAKDKADENKRIVETYGSIDLKEFYEKFLDIQKNKIPISALTTSREWRERYQEWYGRLKNLKIKASTQNLIYRDKVCSLRIFNPSYDAPDPSARVDLALSTRPLWCAFSVDGQDVFVRLKINDEIERKIGEYYVQENLIFSGRVTGLDCEIGANQICAISISASTAVIKK
jgi:hypothetical protein